MDYNYHVFLSYARQDTKIMYPVRDFLKKNGLNVWTDEGISPGTPEWESAIENAIKDIGCMVVILTPFAYKARWVKREIAFAEEHQVLIIPLLVSGETTESVPIRLISHQRIDARQDFDGELENLIGTIRKNLSLPVINHSDATYKIIIPGDNVSPVEKFGDFDHLYKEQKRILTYVREQISEHSISPTVRDIVKGLNISSESVVSHHLDKLIEEGFLDKEGKVARGIRVIRPIPKYNVFLSFSLADQESAYSMQEFLTDRSISVCSPEHSQSSMSLSRLQGEIRDSYCMVILLSPYAKYSIKVLSHLICAQEVQTAIIPVLVSGNPLDSIPSVLPEKFYDMRSEYQEKLSSIFDLTIRLMGKLL